MKEFIVADKEAVVFCSFAFAGFEALLKRETKTTSRRARKLQEMLGRIKEVMDLYPGQVPVEMLDMAGKLFDVLEAVTVEGLTVEEAQTRVMGR